MSYRKTDRPRSCLSACLSTILGVALVMLAGVNARAAPGDLLLTIPQPDGPSGHIFGTFFGDAVASVDGKIIVGAPETTVGGVMQAGAAYVFDGNSGDLMYSLTRPQPFRYQRFGSMLAGDAGRLFVGPSVGDVQVFDAKSGNLLLRRLDATGQAVAASGGKVLIGDPFLEVDGVRFVGGAYLFDAATGQLTQPLPNPQFAQHEFGESVAFLGDRPVVGVSSFDATEMTNENSGRVYVLDPTTGEPALILENPDRQPDEILPRHFGESIATTRDKVIVGANSAGSFGFVYAFDGSTGEMLFRIGKPDSFTGGSDFAKTIATVAGNILVTGPRDDVDGVEDAGSVYLFDGQTGELLLRIPNPEPEPYGNFGSSVAALGDKIIVGHRFSAAVYVFEGVPNIPVGDTDGDWDVDVDDLNAVRNHFGQLGPDDGSLPGDTWPYDGAVDIDDFNRVRNYFGNTRHPSTAVPEPAGALLFSLGILAIAARRRMR